MSPIVTPGVNTSLIQSLQAVNASKLYANILTDLVTRRSCFYLVIYFFFFSFSSLHSWTFSVNFLKTLKESNIKNLTNKVEINLSYRWEAANVVSLEIQVRAFSIVHAKIELLVI